MVFGRRRSAEHSAAPAVKFIPLGGPVRPPSRTAGKTVEGSAGMIQPGPGAALEQPNVSVRKSECALRTPRMMVLCVAGEGEAEEDAVDSAEALLERVIVAAKAVFLDDVELDAEQWLLQEEQRVSLGVTGEAVAITLGFRFPVIHVTRPLVRVGGFTQTCRLNNTFEDDTPAP